MAIKLKQLLTESWNNKASPAKSLDHFLLSNRVVEFGDWLYHGSPLDGLKSMLTGGIYGTQHGEVAEYDTFSTSPNYGVLHYFSDGDGDTGLQFKVDGLKLLVVDEYIHKLISVLPGSGWQSDLPDDDEGFIQFCTTHQIHRDNHRHEFYLPYGYISSLGVDAFMFDYAYKMYERGHMPSSDECEVCFVEGGIPKLNHSISGIWLDGEEYQNKVEALRIIEDMLNDKT